MADKGTPKRYDTHITVALDRELKDWTRKHADEVGVNQSTVVRWALAEMRKRTEAEAVQ